MFSQVPDFKAWFPDIEEFPRPDWNAIGKWIGENVSAEKLDDAWQAITREWLQRLCERLGKSYSIGESQNFHLLSELDVANQENLLTFLEQARVRMLQRLGDIPLPKRHGKDVILRFTEDDEYYRYISYFDRDGEYAGSGGRFLNRDYKHIAYPHTDMVDVDGGTLVHELSHNLLDSFPLPLWLDEALAMAFASDLARSRQPPVTRELAEEHRAYWNPQTIQEFWEGLSFSQVEGQKLAYSLSGILLNLIATELRPPPAQFRDFVLHADYKDAGQSAAQEYLEIDLSDLVGTFLGPGEWTPASGESSEKGPVTDGGSGRINAQRSWIAPISHS
jgi:hypothetical protein